MDDWLRMMVPWGTEVIVWVQSWSNPGLDALALFLTSLGYEEFYLLLLPFIYWCIDKEIGVALGYASLLSAWSNSLLKHLFRIPRPSDPRLHVAHPETDPSFPSGHAQNAVVNWGFLAHRLNNRLLWILAVVLILGIGLSRIVLGVHFPQDVIAGWLVGLLLLVAFAWAAPRLGCWLQGKSVAMQILLAVALPLVLVLVHPADMGGRYPSETALVSMSALVGLGVGAIMERRMVDFQVKGHWWRRGLRFLIGLVAVVLCYAGPKLFLPQEMVPGLESLLRFVRYALVGWVVAFFCPWLFVRVRLADGALRAGDD